MPVTFIVYGGFLVPRTPNNGANFIVITVPDRSALTMPWSTQILPVVARLVQPWFPKETRRRVVRREKTKNGVLEYCAYDRVPPPLKKVKSEVYLDGGYPGLEKTKATRRFVWRDKKLEEDTSP